MRINQLEKEAIIITIKQFFGDDLTIFLFGSRVFDNKKGGDIDIYIKLNHQLNLAEKLDRKLKAITKLMQIIGEQQIDLVINDSTDHKLIYTMAEQKGVRLC